MTDQVQFTKILRDKKLRVTQPRLAVLKVVSHSRAAVSQPELERLLGHQIDRVTLYRCLAAFEEKGILHKVFDLQGTAAYALCSPSCSVHQHADQHAHFICTQCQNVYCLDAVAIPDLPIPSEYQAQSVEVNVTGLCASCGTN